MIGLLSPSIRISKSICSISKRGTIGSMHCRGMDDRGGSSEDTGI